MPEVTKFSSMFEEMASDYARTRFRPKADVSAKPSAGSAAHGERAIREAMEAALARHRQRRHGSEESMSLEAGA